MVNNSQKPKKDELFTWKAPSRPYKKRDRVFFQTAGALAFLLVVIALFIKEWLLVGAILSVVFVSYVLAAVPPQTINNKITRKGIWAGERFYRFSSISEYWFEAQLDTNVLALIVSGKRQTKISLVVGKEKEKVDKALRERVVFREKPPRSVVDRISSWLSEKVPLEEPKKAAS